MDSNRQTRGSAALWIVVAVCAAFLVLWICGVRFPRAAAPVVVAELDAYEDEEAEPLPPLTPPSRAFDVELPEEPETLDDGRDPDAVLL
jgi:hypothetical protein